MKNKLKTNLKTKLLKKQPIRICIACRERDYKKNLIRVVKEKTGRIFVDDLKKSQGRGAYLCFKSNCFKILQKKKGLERNFKRKIDKEIYIELEKRIKNLTGFK